MLDHKFFPFILVFILRAVNNRSDEVGVQVTKDARLPPFVLQPLPVPSSIPVEPEHLSRLVI